MLSLKHILRGVTCWSLPLTFVAFAFITGGCDKKGAPLFSDNLSNARFDPGTWAAADGILKANGKGAMLWTDKEYGNFQLDFEFRTNQKTNSGIFLRCPNPDALKKNRNHHHQNALEFELIHSGKRAAAKMGAGSLLTVQGPATPVVLSPGKWYAFTITAQDSVITASFDGKKLYDCDLSKWTKPGKNPDGSQNILKAALKNLPKKGFIGFQDAGGQVEFRNIKISEF